MKNPKLLIVFGLVSCKVDKSIIIDPFVEGYDYRVNCCVYLGFRRSSQTSNVKSRPSGAENSKRPRILPYACSYWAGRR